MPSVSSVGHAGLQGWREKVADAVSEPVSRRVPLDEDQVRALIGGTFFVLSVMYVVKTVANAARQAGDG